MKINHLLKTRGHLAKWIFIVMAFQLLCSCGMPKMLKTHLADDDVYGLISDYSQYKKYKSAISQHLETSHNFDTDTYTTVENYKKAAQGDSLEYLFQGVLKNKQDKAILAAGRVDNNADALLAFYNQNYEVKNYISPVIEQRLERLVSYATTRETIDIYNKVRLTDFNQPLEPAIGERIKLCVTSASYPETREIHRALNGTPIDNIVIPYYTQRREEYLPVVKSKLDAHCKKELSMLSKCQKEGASTVKTMAQDASSSIMNELMQTHIPSKSAQVNKLFENLNARFNPVVEIKDQIKASVTQMLTGMERERKNFYSDVVGTPIPNSARVGTVPIKVVRVKPKCPSKTLMDIGAIQAQTSGYETMNDLFGIYDTFDNFGLGFSGVWGLMATVAGWFFEYKAEAAKAERARKIEPKLKTLNKAVINEMNNACTKEYNTSFGEIKKAIINTQTKLRQEVMENY